MVKKRLELRIPVFFFCVTMPVALIGKGTRCMRHDIPYFISCTMDFCTILDYMYLLQRGVMVSGRGALQR